MLHTHFSLLPLSAALAAALIVWLYCTRIR